MISVWSGPTCRTVINPSTNTEASTKTDQHATVKPVQMTSEAKNGRIDFTLHLPVSVGESWNERLPVNIVAQFTLIWVASALKCGF